MRAAVPLIKFNCGVWYLIYANKNEQLTDQIQGIVQLHDACCHILHHRATINCYTWQLHLSVFQTFYFISFLLVVVYAWKSKNAIQGWRATEDEGGQVKHPLHLYVIICTKTVRTDSIINFFLPIVWFTESMQKENTCYTCICLCVVSLLIAWL